jgi:hypothetical protein
MTQSTIHPDSLFQKGTSGEYYLQVKSVAENSGKDEYLLRDADWHEYKAIASELYPNGNLLRCMVEFRIKRGKLLIENVSICSEQNLTTQTSNEKNNPQKEKKGDAITHLNEAEQSNRAAIVEDVKKLMEAKATGKTREQLKSEIIRLHRVIVESHLQGVVIEGCGKEGLKMVLGLARSIRRREKKKGDKKWLSGKGDSDYKKLDNALRNKWLEWFKRKFGSTVKNKTEKQLYEALMMAANYLNFVELQEACISEAQFYQNGLGHCFQIAKNLNFIKLKPPTSKKKSTPKNRRKKTQNSYLTSGSPHVTKKDWGSLYKPARG